MQFTTIVDRTIRYEEGMNVQANQNHSMSFDDKTMSSVETYSPFVHNGIGVLRLPKEPSVQLEFRFTIERDYASFK